MAELLILTSPPASGKTFWIGSFARALDDSLLVISPLRALADECKRKWGGAVHVVTPEEWLKHKTPSSVVIFDEFHLLHYWGSSFRPAMWEVFFALACEASLVVGLTATFSDELKVLTRSFECHFSDIWWADSGNHALKFPPREYIHVPRALAETFLLNLPSEKTTLVFCQFRDQVLEWEEKLKERGYQVWTCRGGEAAGFGEKVIKECPPDFIVSTTVLSHGVNLPEIKRIFYLYPVRNKDFWIQMTARGGRQGQSYVVFALERPYDLRWGKGKNFLHVLRYFMKSLANIFLSQVQECFLKV